MSAQTAHELESVLTRVRKLKADNARLRQLLKDARDAIPNWSTGVNDGLLFDIECALESEVNHG